ADAANSINRTSRGNTPVAILGSQSFDPRSEVASSSLTCGHTGEERSLAFCSSEDVNHDGFGDLVCHFTTRSMAFAEGDTQAFLKGKLYDGRTIVGVDWVNIVNTNAR